MFVRSLLTLAVTMAAIPVAAVAQLAPPDDAGAWRHQATAGADANDRPFDLWIGAGATPSLYHNLSDGGHLMAGVLWPSVSRARLRLESLASFADWGYLGLEPGEDPETVEPRWIDRGIKPLLGLGAFLELNLDFGPARPYGFVGPALHYARWPEDSPRTDWGLAAGGGVAFDIVGWHFFAEASLRVFGMAERVTNDAQAIIPLTVGIRF